MSTPQISGLARLLVQHGRLSDADAEALQASANTNKTTFIEQLTQSKKLSARDVAEFSSQTFGYPLLDIDRIDSSYLPQGVIDNNVMRAQRIVPLFKRGTKLFIGISDITNLEAVEKVRFQTNAQVEPIIVEDNKLIVLINRTIDATGANLKEMDLEDVELALDGGDPEPTAAETQMGQDIDDAPIVKYLQKILMDAINGGASDIHFEPYEKFYRIRFRIDGVLREIAQPPLAIKEKISSRIKVISKLDISEKRIPQDGRMKLVLSKSRAIDFRVSTLPTMHGEKIVMRILDPSSATLGIDALGYDPDQKAIILEAIQRPYGMVLVTGPTGSGKTVSLYTCLNLLNKPDINIATAEDPCEINLPGINQVNVNDKAGLTFSAALKAFLRQDPDIIMVGEIRDLETADIAIKAAQTGHMVFSTLHTNDAPTTLTRMLNMGIQPFNIASSVILITAQRLARRLCSCKKHIDLPNQALIDAGFTQEDLDGTWQPYGPVGCEICKDTGYKGRVGIYQVMPITDEINRLIMNHGNAIDIADQARKEGVLSLREAGLRKVKQGLTSLEEVMAVTNV
ncbi:type IV-A pilus assembly ATPase PilB [Chitinibacter bivalviorum]|uniref:Type IV-A pilus assembly ATPase PilB n=1 Tax=Chitinibacter bivalviorum TaxID=2739434 RepID=A0A7H9BK23_9NEIS|nr:type IV-A pilus assembly ATPase PilB [Chitinibacter bivalviorum]QLG88676.1 type IV-A pilus assembly ATPase PilB [Chitinibacter bivalviorum]